jgi:hypothetical protein
MRRRDALQGLTRFDPVPAFPADGREFLAAVDGWVRSAPMAALVSEFGGVLPQSVSLLDLLTTLEDFSSQWDNRRGAERNFVRRVPLGRAKEELVLEVAIALGLGCATVPTHGHFDHIVILGGLAPACFARCEGAADFMRRSKTKPQAVTALGALRPLGNSEEASVGDLLKIDPADEFAALDTGLRLAFGLDDTLEERWQSGRIRSYLDSRGIPIRVVAAPTQRAAATRANTADTMDWFAKRIAHLRGGERLLLVTTSLYVPYQHVEGLRVLGLPYQAEIEMYGVHPSDMDRRFAPDIQSHHYLQEIRSTIRALGNLVRSLTGTHAPPSADI